MSKLKLRWRSLADRRILGGLTLVASGIFETGCYPKSAPAPIPLSSASVATAAMRWPGTTEDTLTKGHDLFLAKCKGCHGYPDLIAYPEADWPHIIEKMGKKSNLVAYHRDVLLHYVLAARAEEERAH